MATQICPKCKQDSFTWYMDDDEASGLTIWHCFNCRYVAYEDEQKIRDCLNCLKNTSSYLMDTETIFYWCNNCNEIEFLKNK
ncbi:hypothetical protein CLV94_2377 [Flavobacterium endophyticum]|uniref:Uncharacterized protein n=1 Tax=Flavobacterium endophyticum TaxID=1540163 RepID=A0A495M9B2_9FLAO|nr:hypothetical protein CLV94_2377 [Flavobacterium endophyticum]